MPNGSIVATMAIEFLVVSCLVAALATVEVAARSQGGDAGSRRWRMEVAVRARDEGE
jgi:hypothetical protein